MPSLRDGWQVGRNGGRSPARARRLLLGLVDGAKRGQTDTPREEWAGKGSRRSSEENRLDAVPVKVRSPGHPPRAKGIYHVGCTDYPDPTYP